MKNKKVFMPSPGKALSPGPSPNGRGESDHYWRSLGELNDTPEFRALLDAEFPANDDQAGISRRRWLQLMGASLVLAGAASCRWEKREILPFDKRPANRTPGKFERFATTMDMGGTVLGLMVTCVDGRPIKVEGNPKHPSSLGATNAYAQAAILELYDPDRSRNIVQKTDQGDEVKSWDEFAAFAKSHFGELRKNGGQGLAVLSEVSTSPTLAAQRKKLLADFPKAVWLDYEPVVHESGDLRTHLHLDKAEVIVCARRRSFRQSSGRGKACPRFRRRTRGCRRQDEPPVRSRKLLLHHRRNGRSPPARSAARKSPAFAKMLYKAITGRPDEIDRWIDRRNICNWRISSSAMAQDLLTP